MPRRSRRARKGKGTEKEKGGKGKKFLVVFVLLVLLAGGCLAALLFVPRDAVPEQVRGQVDAIRAKLVEVGLPVAPSALPLEVPSEPGEGADADPEAPEEAVTEEDATDDM